MFHSLFVSQVIFHHFFLCGLADITNCINTFGGFSVEFETEGQFCYLSVRFWKQDSLCKVTLLRFSRTSVTPRGHFSVISQLLSAITTESDLVCCSGCPYDVFLSVDGCSLFTRGVQFPFRFSNVDLAKMMHQQSYSFFGRIDFFSVLEYLVVSLSGVVRYRWTFDTPELVKVSNISDILLIGMS